MTRLQEILSTIQNGFFFEAGANDGVEESNTHFLELNGWQGILVEPNPDDFKKGIDAQLQKAVEVILKDMQAGDIKKTGKEKIRSLTR